MRIDLGKFWSEPFFRLAGALLALLGGAVMLGGNLQSAGLPQILPDSTPMMFSTALCFTLAGAALLWSSASPLRNERVLTACGGIVAAIAVLVLAKRALPEALAFLMSGAALVLIPRVRHAWQVATVRTLAFTSGTIGAIGLAGYFVGASLLFPRYRNFGVGPSTAAGLLLLAFGAGSYWRQFEWGRARFFARDDDRITFASAAVLGAVALGAVVATFSILQATVQAQVRDHIQAALANRSAVFQDLIRMHELQAQSAALRPAAARNLRVIRAGGDDGSNVANLKAVVDSFLRLEFSAIAYYDADGKLVASGGNFVQAPAISAPLATPAGAELMWNDGLLLRHRFPMQDSAGKVGEVLIEQPMPVLTRMVWTAAGAGATWDMGLCVLRGQQLECFPQRLNKQAFFTPLHNVAGERLPMTHALRGETGAAISRDYRGQNVLAAYGPVGNLGLGMVVKVDTTEVFAPIREQLLLAIGVLLAVIAAGTLLLRAQVMPLATRMQGALEERAAGLHRAQQMSKLAHIVAGPDGRFESWSDTLPQMTGLDPAAIPNSTREWLAFVHPEDRAVVRAKFIEAARTGLRVEFEYRLRRADGSWMDINQTSEALLEPSSMPGKPRWFGTLQDVTERKHAEADRERLVAIVASTDDAIISKNLDGVITSWNQGAERIFGYPAQEAIGKPMTMLVPPERAGEEPEILARIANGEHVHHFETVRVARSGTRIDISATISPIRDGHGRAIGASKIARDITERKRAEAKIRHLNRVHAVLSGINSMIVRVRGRDELFREACRIAVEAGGFKLAWIGLLDQATGDIDVVSWHGAGEGYIERMPLGKGRNPFGGRNLSMQAIAELKATISNDMARDPHILLKKESLERGLQSLAILPLLAPGEVIGVLALYAGEVGFFDNEEIRLLKELAGDIAYAVEHIDLDKRVKQRTAELNATLDKLRKSEAELEQRVLLRTAELESANRELEAFSYSVSHDLRAPLRHIDGFAQMLREDCAPMLDASGTRYLDVITDSVKQMGQLIDDLLLFSKMGRVEMHQALVSMDGLVAEVVKMQEGEINGRTLEWAIDPLPEVRGDRAMLRQVWANLLSNSVKYTRTRPVAKVRIGYSEATGEFHVQDNGAGFDMTYADKLFGVFQRLHRAEEFEGTGVGLANVQRIISRHGGRIRAQGKVDEGAAFYFTLPLHRAGAG